MNYLAKRIGLLIYGGLSIIESLINALLYITHLDIFISPMDKAMPFYFWYTNKFLKSSYITKLKDNHG